MKAPKQLCTPRKSIFDVSKRDTLLNLGIVRHALFAAYKTAETEGTRDSITWLKTEVKDYATNRQGLIEPLEFLAALRQVTTMQHWHKDSAAAGLLAGSLRNRQDNV
jgi:hypothetical protein